MSNGARGMTDSELKYGIRRAYCGVKELEKLLSNDLMKTAWPTLTKHRDRLQKHQDRLWTEYKRRFMHEQKWPADERGPDSGMLTPDGFRKAHCDPDRLREESLRELRHTARAYEGGGGIEYIDPVLTLQSAELEPVRREYLALMEAEIARRERRRGRKAA